VAYGVCIGPSENPEYLAAVEVADFAGLPKDYQTLPIRARKYVVFPHSGRASELRNVIYTIVNQWLPNSSHELTTIADQDAAQFERYGEAFDPETGAGNIEVWVPIKN